MSHKQTAHDGTVRLDNLDEMTWAEFLAYCRKLGLRPSEVLTRAGD